MPECRLICAVDQSPRADRAEHRLVALAARHRLEDFAVEAVPGAPVPALVALSREPSTGAIVIGSRGLGALRSLPAGSVAWRLVRESECPVVLAARTATALAARMGARLVFAHVAPTATAAEAWLHDVLPGSEPEVELGRHVLDEAVACAEGAGARVRTVRIGHGRPGADIAALALEEAADLVVVGAPRHSRLGAVLLGSAFEELRRGRQVPTVVCPVRRPG